jgi:membrane-associated phospholipid phosphatase
MVSPDNPEIVATPRAKRVASRWPLVSGLAVVGLGFALGALIVVRDKGLPLTVDTQWMTELVENRAPVWEFLSLVMNNIGGGVIATFIVPVLITAALLLLKRRWAAGYYLVATVLTGGIVQLLKHLFGRARPGALMVNVDFGSFPSGHVANAAAMAVIVSMLFPRLWIWIAGAVYTIVMMISRTYLGAHWLSDTIGGLLLGVGVAIVVWAPLAAKLDGERTLRSRHSPPGRLEPGAQSADETI